MSRSRFDDKLDVFATGFALQVIKYRWIVLLAAVLVTLGIASNASKLEFANNYRVFFSSENPELKTFEELQATYTKNDNFLFVLEPRDEQVFTRETLTAIEQLTDSAWQLPFSLRVDSITNFQHTYAEEDDLIVEPLVEGAQSLSDEELLQKKQIALDEPLIRDQLLTDDATVTAVNVVMQYPELSLTEVPDAVAAARALRDQIEQDFPNIDVHLTGVSMLNNAFSEAGFNDLGTLVPLMFVVVLILTAISLRSFSAMGAVFVIIILSIMVAMGFAGIVGIKLTPPSASAPIIILTLAVADSIHVLMTMRNNMRNGMPKQEALVDAVRINFLAVAITSLTTVIGFLALNFSDSPPFRHLGTITAVGIVAAWVFSITVLVALISIVPFKPAARPEGKVKSQIMRKFADMVIERARLLLIGMTIIIVGLIAFIPTITLDDQWREYFDTSIEFRQETDRTIDYFGFYQIEYSVPAGEAGGISEPEYLSKLEAFTEFLREQEDVMHVYSLVDIMKRLNRNLNGDDAAYYKVPEDRDMAAQYLLLYELSLPYGLDLNDRVNLDKSETRVTANLSGYTSTAKTKAFLENVDKWFDENAPELKTPPTSPQVMFTFIAERNVQSMVSGTLIAIFAISIVLIFALRSLSMGVLSLVPNGLPILAAFGAWALLVGFVGFSVAAIAAISLGIVVDDTVHFLTKFVRARRQQGLSVEDSIRFAFETVGVALIVNTVILSIGFSILTFSSFKINAEMGLLTTLCIIFALILDFLLLPPILLLLGKKQKVAS